MNYVFVDHIQLYSRERIANELGNVDKNMSIRNWLREVILFTH